ncbi:MAG TPA: pyruvate kinase [Fimbriiglobus sp.]|jgi:pyruvate kinase
MPRRTKIVATLGPATDTAAALESILRAGVDVARINFSHGSADGHLDRIAKFRAAADRVGKVAAVMADLPGPKLRAKILEPRSLVVGDTLTFSLSSEAVDPRDVVITEPEVLAGVRPGHRVLLDDGRLQLIALDTADGRLSARVLVGGTLSPNKGINLPDTPLSIPTCTERDRAALEIAAKAGVDWVAVSFVRGPDAAAEVRAAMADVGMNVPILAKIERPEAVDRAAAIIHVFDGIMVARGDLGVEIPLERVPTVQKQLIAAARAVGKPVITATDMLDSMQKNLRPTRAEASDVANAIFDGTDAVMLSGETAVGLYPVESVACMSRIAEETESHLEQTGRVAALPEFLTPSRPIDDPLAQAACDLASEIGAAAIITPTLSGRTAGLLARYRPWARVVAPAPTAPVLRRMTMVWGIRPVPMQPLNPGDDRMLAAVRDAFAAGAVANGDRVVVLAGHPIEGGPRFPTVRVVRVGESGASQEP